MRNLSADWAGPPTLLGGQKLPSAGCGVGAWPSVCVPEGGGPECTVAGQGRHAAPRGKEDDTNRKEREPRQSEGNS